MTSNLNYIIHQIDTLNQNEKLKLFQYLAQQLQVPLASPNLSDDERLVQYIQNYADQESERSLKDFKGIAPNLIDGQDAQDWVNQQRNEWTDRQVS